MLRCCGDRSVSSSGSLGAGLTVLALDNQGWARFVCTFVYGPWRAVAQQYRKLDCFLCAISEGCVLRFGRRGRQTRAAAGRSIGWLLLTRRAPRSWPPRSACSVRRDRRPVDPGVVRMRARGTAPSTPRQPPRGSEAGFSTGPTPKCVGVRGRAWAYDSRRHRRAVVSAAVDGLPGARHAGTRWSLTCSDSCCMLRGVAAAAV